MKFLWVFLTIFAAPTPLMAQSSDSEAFLKLGEIYDSSQACTGTVKAEIGIENSFSVELTSDNRSYIAHLDFIGDKDYHSEIQRAGDLPVLWDAIHLDNNHPDNSTRDVVQHNSLLKYTYRGETALGTVVAEVDINLDSRSIVRVKYQVFRPTGKNIFGNTTFEYINNLDCSGLQLR